MADLGRNTLSHPNPPTSHPQFFEETFQRIQAVTGLRTQQALANLLEIRQSSISDAKNRNSIPSDWVLTLFTKLGVNSDWLVQGIGPVYLRTDQSYIPSDHNPIIPDHMLSEYAPPAVIPLHSTYLPFEVTGRLAVPHHFPFKDCMAFRVESDVLFPSIRHDSFVGINMAQRRPVDTETYAIVWKDFLVFRKVKVVIGADTQLCILNEMGCKDSDALLPMEEIKKLIWGRLAWVIQEF